MAKIIENVQENIWDLTQHKQEQRQNATKTKKIRLKKSQEDLAR
jgi:hypothetical protein